MAVKNKELIDKLKKLISGELGTHTLSKTEQDEVLALLSDTEKAEKTREALGLDSIEEVTSLFPSLLGQATNGESYLARLEKKMQRGELTEKLSGAFNTLVGLTQLGVSANQINKSNKDLGVLNPPGTPSIPQEDPALSNAIYEAGRGTFDAGRAASVAKRQIRNNRLVDEAQARQIAGGQAGIYGALNQASALRTNRGYAELTPMIDSIRAREQARLDNLLQMRQQNRQTDFNNRMSIYDQANQNYRNDMNAAGQLGQAGRENLFTSLGGLSNSLAVMGGGINFRNKTGVKELDDFNSKANANLSSHMNPYYNTAPRQPVFDENWNILPSKY